MDKELEKGFEQRAAMFGRDKAERAMALQGRVIAPFQQLMTRECFGALWADDTISPRDRSLITMSLLAASGKADELKVHAELAIRNGVEADVMAELVRHVAIYCGVPNGGLAGRVLQEALDAR